jgi:hypothetical protein
MAGGKTPPAKWLRSIMEKRKESTMGKKWQKVTFCFCGTASLY